MEAHIHFFFKNMGKIINNNLNYLVFSTLYLSGTPRAPRGQICTYVFSTNSTATIFTILDYPPFLFFPASSPAKLVLFFFLLQNLDHSILTPAIKTCGQFVYNIQENVLAMLSCININLDKDVKQHVLVLLKKNVFFKCIYRGLWKTDKVSAKNWHNSIKFYQRSSADGVGKQVIWNHELAIHLFNYSLWHAPTE